MTNDTEQHQIRKSITLVLIAAVVFTALLAFLTYKGLHPRH